MAGANGRNRIWTPLGLGSAENEPEGVTIEEWAKKGDRAVNRAELVAVLDAYLMTKVKAVMAYVLDKRVAQLRREMAEIVLEREEFLRAHRWYRRLGRWIATFGHSRSVVLVQATKAGSPDPKHEEAPPQTFKDFDEIDRIVGEAEGLEKSGTDAIGE